MGLDWGEMVCRETQLDLVYQFESDSLRMSGMGFCFWEKRLGGGEKNLLDRGALPRQAILVGVLGLACASCFARLLARFLPRLWEL